MEKYNKYGSGGRRVEKAILDVLRNEGPKTEKDIVSNGVIKENASERAKKKPDTWRRDVENHLGRLGFLGVVVEEGGLWWYAEHKIVCAKEDYDTLMKHASVILPGFIEISNQYKGSLHSEEIRFIEVPLGTMIADNIHFLKSSISKEFVFKCAKQHLKTGYPNTTQIDRALNENEALENLRKSIQEKVKIESSAVEILLSDTRVRNIAELIIHDLAHKEKKLQQRFVDGGKEVILGGFAFSKKGKGGQIAKKLKSVALQITEEYKSREEYKRVKDVLELPDLSTSKPFEFEDRLNEIKREADKELLSIILGVLSGKPLQGKCDECPRVKLSHFK